MGSDQYWGITTGEIVKIQNGPTALDTQLGWVLSGPIAIDKCSESQTTLVTHVLRVDSKSETKALDKNLRAFWDIESLGILEREDVVQTKFERHVSFGDGYYTVSLPWRDHCLSLPSNYELCVHRLNGLLRRLKRSPELLEQYNNIILEQLALGIVVPVNNLNEEPSTRLHYLPHHAVVRQDKATIKLRIIYDVSAKSEGPSLNECLHIGPSLNQKIFDILLRFRLHAIALIADIEKAFLMVRVAQEDQDVLRFLWISSIHDEKPEIREFKFTRVVFGVALVRTYSTRL